MKTYKFKYFDRFMDAIADEPQYLDWTKSDIISEASNEQIDCKDPELYEALKQTGSLSLSLESQNARYILDISDGFKIKDKNYPAWRVDLTKRAIASENGRALFIQALEQTKATRRILKKGLKI